MVGETLGQYRVVEKIGAGGMGVVYRAEDTKLKRSVALKFLPEQLASDPVALERFRREARTASALSHPAICTIHDIADHDHRPFIVMEFLDGQTLRRRINGKPLPLEEILDLAIQLVAGLEAAHSQDLIHRDLKPENIFITTRGHLKILDFGLARLADDARAQMALAEQDASTATDMLTGPGRALGTVAYMSPEQALGTDLDRRTDLFSLGVVLYEMATGVQPFRGATSTAVLDALLNQQPVPAHRRNPDVPDELDRIVAKALEKDRDLRYQSVLELATDLRRLKRDSDPNHARAAARRVLPRWPKRRTMIAVAGGAAVLAAVLLFATGLPGSWRRPTPPVLGRQAQATFVGDAQRPALSPDGSFLTYTSGTGLMLQDSRGGSAVRLSRPTTAWQRWSPDASQILVRSFEDFPDIQLELVPRLGGPARVVARDVMRGTASWSPDGTLIATPAGKGFLLINVATGAATSVTVDDVRSVENVHDWSGATDLLLVGMFTNRGGWALYCARRDGSQIRRILSDKGISAAYWSPAGDAVYYSHTTDKDVGEVVWVPVDPGTGTVLGTPSVVVGGLEPGTAFAMSGDASRIALERSQLFTNLLLRDLHADELKAASQDKKLTQSSLRNGNPAVSPDGKWIVFTAGQFRSWKRNLYKMPIGGGPATQLTSLDSGAYGPAWSPDGKRIAFTGDKTGGRAVWVVNADGGEPRMLADSDMEGGQGYPLTWAPGNRILFTARGGKTFAIDPDAGGKQALPKDDEFFTQGQPFYSPDGARVAVRGNGGVWVVSAADGVGELRIKEDLSLLGWHPDGRSLIVLTRDRQILNVPLMGGARRQLTALPREVTDIAMSPDGQRLVYAVDQYWSDIWLLENLNPGRQRK